MSTSIIKNTEGTEGTEVLDPRPVDYLPEAFHAPQCMSSFFNHSLLFSVSSVTSVFNWQFATLSVASVTSVFKRHFAILSVRSVPSVFNL